jgi:hypothetical protein
MSQRTVERILGKLATDEEARQRFRSARRDTVDALAGEPGALTPVEREALSALDPDLLDRVADEIDPRLQRVRLPNDVLERSEP